MFFFVKTTFWQLAYLPSSGEFIKISLLDALGRDGVVSAKSILMTEAEPISEMLCFQPRDGIGKFQNVSVGIKLAQHCAERPAVGFGFRYGTPLSNAVLCESVPLPSVNKSVFSC
jgi:hypothetical protein